MSETRRDRALNALGTALVPCSYDPLTGWYRDGCCHTDAQDHGSHVICAKVTVEFLNFQMERGNDLITPRPEHRFRGPSEERLLPAQGVVAQAYTGPAGQKQVWWQRGSRAGTDGRVEVWTNGQRRTEAGYLAASALVAEAYGLFLLGPLWLVGRSLPAAMAGTERVHGRLCDVVEVEMSPGLGLVSRDRVAVCIDRDDGICRRVRFTLEGYPGTRGAVAETDTFEHQRRFGVLWPMRSYEEVVHPIRLPAHDWHITGLDVNRGITPESLQGPRFTGAAAAPAARV